MACRGGGDRAAHVRRRASRLLRPDARARLPRRGRPRPASGHSLERPADGRRVRGDRGASRARAPDRADGKPGADGLHGAEAPLAAPPRARGLRSHPAHPAPEGLRDAAAHRRARDRRRGRVRDAALRRTPPPLVGRGRRRARDPARLAASCLRVDGVRRGRRPAGGGTRRRRRPAGDALGRSRHVRRRLRGAPRVPRRARGARPRLLSRRARHLGGDGRDAERGRCAALVPRHARARHLVRRARRRGGGVAGRSRGADLPALSGRRAHAPRGPVRAGHVRGTVPPT